MAKGNTTFHSYFLDKIVFTKNSDLLSNISRTFFAHPHFRIRSVMGNAHGHMCVLRSFMLRKWRLSCCDSVCLRQLKNKITSGSVSELGDCTTHLH